MAVKNKDFNPVFQSLNIHKDGTILSSDKKLFSWPINSSIFDAHPFFEILRDMDYGVIPKDEALDFPCVHIEEGNNHKICDLHITFKSDQPDIIIFDYTEKYKSLNKVAQVKNESVLLAKELELKNKYLLEKEEFKNNFIANINHEIRTPLTSMLGFVEVLEKTNLAFEQEELVRIIKRDCLHLNTLIDDMIDISKIESGGLKIIEEKFSLHQLIRGFEESYGKVADKRGLEFRVKFDESIEPFLIGDKVRVYQVINNLLSNAFKFTEKGEIALNIEKNFKRSNKTNITITVKDTGIGIIEEDIPFLFDRFTRFNQNKNISGTGLGLAIVQSLVDSLGGEIKVISEVEKGSSFMVKLPFTFELTKSSSPDRKKKKYTLPEQKQKFRILVVEDQESTQFLMMKILITHGRFFVDVVMNGQDALKYIEKRTYDAILMDLNLPGMDGYQITHKIRNTYGDKIISEVPIIAFTAQKSEKERDKCLRSGMDDYIAKPFQQEDLIQVITKQIAKKAAD